MERFQQDPDIKNEAGPVPTPLSPSLPSSPLPSPSSSPSPPYRFVPLLISQGHQASHDSAALFREAGGKEAILRMTGLFYESAFKDPVLDKFIRDRNDPHAERFANWIGEKLGTDSAWTDERRSREIHQITLASGAKTSSPSDRSTAHGSAWYSAKREPEKVGRRFKLDDCRVWMRLHFWALKKAKVHEASPSFAEFYCRFIGHFISVYEGNAPAFARDSYRWSDTQSNLDEYERTGKMADVVDRPEEEAERSIREVELRDPEWPYWGTFEDMTEHYDSRGDGFDFYNN